MLTALMEGRALTVSERRTHPAGARAFARAFNLAS
jgi:hypothetical protein